MPLHCDPESLALLALGEPADSPADEAHLAGCVACQSELDQLKAVIHASRTITGGDRPVTPAPAVWGRIEAELGLAGTTSADHGTVVPLRRRRPVGAALLAAAAAVTGIAVGAGVMATLQDDRDTGTVVARTALDPLPQHSASGTAVLSTADDRRDLTVEVAGLTAATNTFYEVWLLAPDASRLMSLGLLQPGQATTFELPADLDLAEYPVVDVSLEPMDGDPAHSSDSVVRGTLSA